MLLRSIIVTGLPKNKKKTKTKYRTVWKKDKQKKCIFGIQDMSMGITWAGTTEKKVFIFGAEYANFSIFVATRYLMWSLHIGDDDWLAD